MNNKKFAAIFILAIVLLLVAAPIVDAKLSDSFKKSTDSIKKTWDGFKKQFTGKQETASFRLRNFREIFIYSSDEEKRRLKPAATRNPCNQNR